MPVLVALGALPGCDPSSDRCGPSSAVVSRVIDGDTVELDSGERVRYLLVDTPEISGGEPECFGPEATQFNTELVLGQRVELRYDVECTDRYDRLLAYVSVGDREVNRLLVERGYACVLYIPPNGMDRVDEYRHLEALAQGGARGLWGACEEVPCR
jgi:micrococcal nuclease